MNVCFEVEINFTSKEDATHTTPKIDSNITNSHIKRPRITVN